MADDPVTMAAIERLEEHRQRLIAEKVARGEAVLRPQGPVAIVGAPCKKQIAELSRRQQRDEQGREIFYDDKEPLVIVTGVPRSLFPCPECDGTCEVKSEPARLLIFPARAREQATSRLLRPCASRRQSRNSLHWRPNGGIFACKSEQATAEAILARLSKAATASMVTLFLSRMTKADQLICSGSAPMRMRLALRRKS